MNYSNLSTDLDEFINPEHFSDIGDGWRYGYGVINGDGGGSGNEYRDGYGLGFKFRSEFEFGSGYGEGFGSGFGSGFGYGSKLGAGLGFGSGEDDGDGGVRAFPKISEMRYWGELDSDRDSWHSRCPQ
jgi:hypothetical protein